MEYILMGKLNDYLTRKAIDKFSSMSEAELEQYTVDKGDHVLQRFMDKLDTTYINEDRGHNALRGRGLSVGQQTELRSRPGAFEYKSPIITMKAYDPANPIHRNIVHDSSAVYAAARKRIIAAITSVKPKFFKKTADKDNEAEEEELTPFERCTKVWDQFRGQRVLSKALFKSIAHGGIIYEPLENIGDWYTEDPFFIRTWDEAKPKEWEYGFPVEWEVKPINKHLTDYIIDVRKWSKSGKLPKDEMVDKGDRVSVGFYYDPNFNGVYHPNPWWFGSWDNTMDYEIIKEARNSFDQRLGNGFLVIGVPIEVYKKVKKQLDNKIRNIRTEMGVVVPISGDQPIELKWVGMEGSRVDFNGDLEDVRSDIIADIGFPKRWLYGDQAGAMESSAKDRLQVMDAIRYEFGKWVQFIKLFLKYHKAIDNLDDVIVKAPYEMLVTEEEKANVENLKVQTVMMKMGVLTPNELRVELGYEELEEEGLDDVLPEVPTDEPEPEQNDNKQQAERVKNDSVEDYLMVQNIMAKYDYDTLAAWLGPSRNTIGKMKNHMKTNLPAMKCDSLPKLDAVSLGGGKYMIEDALLVPVQSKHYDQLGYTAVRSMNELQKIMDDPTKPKEFRIGVNPYDSHDSRVPMEIAEDESVGVVQLKQLKEDGIHGPIIYDLNKSQTILKDKDWIRDYTHQGKKLTTSVALRSVDVDMPDGRKYELNHDLRSFVFTRTPRNTDAGGV